MANVIRKTLETDIHINEDGDVVIYQHDARIDLHGEQDDSFVYFPLNHIDSIINALNALK